MAAVKRSLSLFGMRETLLILSSVTLVTNRSQYKWKVRIQLLSCVMQLWSVTADSDVVFILSLVI